MRLTPTTWAERILPPPLYGWAEPWLARLDALLNGAADREGAKRMALTVFAIRVFGALLAYVSQVILARLMGGHEYGIFVVVWTLVVVFGIIAPFGFSSSVLRLIPQYRANGDHAGLAGLFLGSRLFGLAMATGIAATGCLGIWLFESVITSYYVLPLYLAAVCLPLFTFGSVQDGIARAHDWAFAAMLPTFVWRPLAILIGMILAIRLGWPASAETAAMVAIIATWSIALAQMLYLNRRLKSVSEPAAPSFSFRAWLTISVPILLVEGFFQLITSADVIMVSFFRPPDEVAVYYAASKTLALAHFVYFAVRSATAHRYSRLFHSNDRAGLETLVADTARWTFWPTLFIAALLVVIGPFLLALFGPGFSDGYPLLLILLVGVLARASVGPVDALLTMADQQNRCAMVYASTFVLNVTLNLAFIPWLGLMGAGLATALAMIFEAAALHHQAETRLGLHTFIRRRRVHG